MPFATEKPTLVAACYNERVTYLGAPPGLYEAFVMRAEAASDLDSATLASEEGLAT